MTRALVSPVRTSLLAVLNLIDIDQGGGENIPVGDGEAPDCDPPYIFVTFIVSPQGDGPMSDVEEDGRFRFQVNAVGLNPTSADFARDQARLILTRENFDTVGVSGYRVIRVLLDLGRDVREDRGLPNPFFTASDQYVIWTTPAT